MSSASSPESRSEDARTYEVWLSLWLVGIDLQAVNGRLLVVPPAGAPLTDEQVQLIRTHRDALYRHLEGVEEALNPEMEWRPYQANYDGHKRNAGCGWVDMTRNDSEYTPDPDPDTD